MGQESITRHFDLKNNRYAGEDLINAVLPKPTKTVVNNRKKINGIEFKAFTDDKAKEEMNRFNERYLRAAFAGDTETMFRMQKQFETQAKSLVATGDMSMIEFKTLSPWQEGQNTYGGYSAPPAYAAELARNLGIYCIARKHLRQYPMKSWIENIPFLNGKPSVSAVAEVANIPDSKFLEGQLVLTAYKAAAIYAATNEELEDVNIPLWATAQDIYWEQFGIQEDTNALQDLVGSYGPGLLYYGDGTLASNGAVTSHGATGVFRGGSSTSGKTGFPQIGDAASTSDAWNDWIQMLAAVPSAYYMKGKFFVDQQVALAMFSMRDSQNRFIADIVNGLTVEMGLDGQPRTFFKGYEIVVVPKGIMLNANTTAYTASAVPSTPFTIFCDPIRAWALFGTRGGFRVDNLREGTINSVSLAANDVQALRMVERFAVGCAQPATMVILRTSAS
jgi:HK97 family phage major capsid protein